MDGARQVWCTFSHDQVDLNFKNPQVLMEVLNIIAFYLKMGVRLFRLDAVAFLWKEPCTICLHLEQTHEIIRLFRTLIGHVAEDALIITETNVPSLENFSYLGRGDEAHIIYNFPLPPLLLHTLVTGDSRALIQWLKTLPSPMPGTGWLNFIASHDGIGLRPVEGILSDLELDRLIEGVKTFGARISVRALNDHQSNPYEINISLWDAFKGTLEEGRTIGSLTVLSAPMPSCWRSREFPPFISIPFWVQRTIPPGWRTQGKTVPLTGIYGMPMSCTAAWRMNRAITARCWTGSGCSWWCGNMRWHFIPMPVRWLWRQTPVWWYF